MSPIMRTTGLRKKPTLIGQTRGATLLRERGRRNQNRVALADKGWSNDTALTRRWRSISGAGLSRLKELLKKKLIGELMVHPYVLVTPSSRPKTI